MSQRLYKGRTNNHVTWVMVDATDFATPESALSAATKIKIYGKLRGGTGTNFVSSGTGSLTNDITHVGASALGIYTIALVKADLSDASAAWYDQYVVSLSATGAAYQALVCEGAIDESTMSGLISDIQSAVLLCQSAASDAASAAAQANSRVLLVQSRLSDFDSRLVSDVSDVKSFLSDVKSLMSTTGVTIGASSISDIRSAISAGPAATVTASDISDIASAVKAALASDVSDILSAAVQTNSRALVIQSLVSDVDSALTSRFSDLHSHVSTTGVQLNASSLSDLRSAITAVTATVTASDISDIASAVKAAMASDVSDILSAAVQTNSRALVIQSLVSDVDSALTSRFSDFHSHVSTTGVQLNASSLSDLRSAITAVTATVTASDISDIASAVKAAMASDVSDILSAAVQTNSRVLLNQSRISDIASFLVVMSAIQSDIYSNLAAGVTIGASSLSDLASAVWATAGADPAAVIGTTAAMSAKIDWLAALARNKITQTATVQTLRNDADAATVASAAVSDDGATFTRGKFA